MLKMNEGLRLAFGIMGNATTLMLYTSPIFTFKRVIRKRSTEEYSCLPYILALLNCLLYAWYGLPVVSYKWENLPVISTNGLGLFFELSFVLIYICFATSKVKVKVAVAALAVITVFCITVFVSTFSIHDHRHRKLCVGSIGLLASVAMYSSPLVAMKKVIATKSVEFMPFHLSFFSFLSSSCWLAYGLLSRDLLLAAPNMIGCPLCFFQLVLYFKYISRKEIAGEKFNKWDLGNQNNDNSKQMQMVDGDCNDTYKC